MLTDNQLIRRIKKKQDRKAADILIDRYYREIYAFTFRQTGQRELAKDLTQEIFIRILQGIYVFDERKASFRTWAYHAASNKITDYYRSKTYKKECMQQSIEQEKGCESGFEKMEMVYLTDLSELMVKKEFGRRYRRDESKVTKYAGRISTGRGNSDAETTDHRKSDAPDHGKTGTASQYLLGAGTESHFLSQSGDLEHCSGWEQQCVLVCNNLRVCLSSMLR